MLWLSILVACKSEGAPTPVPSPPTPCQTVSLFADDDGDGFGSDALVERCEDDRDGTAVVSGDCNDADPLVFPGQVESCDGVDQDCDGQIDDQADDAPVFHADQDGDGFGDASSTVQACDAPAGFVADATDCDDGRADVSPAQAELCDDTDNDCDGLVDEELPIDTWYLDSDGDGFGDPNQPREGCAQPTATVTDATDCNDAAADVAPGATETCNDRDDDCDGHLDEGLPLLVFYQDADADDYGDASITTEACGLPAGYAVEHGDCDDGNALVAPDQVERCNGLDDNCDAVVDLDAIDRSAWYPDDDLDGFGRDEPELACEAPAGMVAHHGDCDDANVHVFPGQIEQCDGVDEDCDGAVDDGAIDRELFYLDADRDGYGDTTLPVLACEADHGYAAVSGDCDDTRDDVSPAATEVCNDDLDNDCSDGDCRDATTEPSCQVPGIGELVCECSTWEDVNPNGALACIDGAAGSSAGLALFEACTTVLTGANENGQLDCIAAGAPSDTPIELVTACEALPTTISGKIHCIAGAAASADPTAVIDACTTVLTGANINGQLDCIASAGASPDPTALVTTCEALQGANVNGKLDCIANAASAADPAAVHDACVNVLTGVNLNGQLDCIASASASPVPAALVASCEAMAGVNVNGKLDCIAGAAISPDPAAVVHDCQTVLTGANVNGQLACVASAGQSPLPSELILACETMSGVNVNGKLACLDSGATSPEPQHLVTACQDVLTGVNVNGELECIDHAGSSPDPLAAVTACEGASTNYLAKLACIEAAGDALDPGPLVDACLAMPNGSVVYLLCIDAGDASIDAAATVAACLDLDGANSNAILGCIGDAEHSPDPTALVHACENVLTGANLNGQLDCIDHAAYSPQPLELVAACEALPGLSVNGKLSCIENGSSSPDPTGLVEACGWAFFETVSGMLECIESGAP